MPISGDQRDFNLGEAGVNSLLADSRNVHIHTDSRCSSLAVHDRHSGDDIDQSCCQSAVQRPYSVSVLLFYPHLTHHLTRGGRQNVHLEETQWF